MGFLDALFKQATSTASTNTAGGLGDLVTTVTKNPQILSALGGLLSTRDSSVGGSAGLAGLVGAFQKQGLGDMVSSWISTGPNPPISETQVSSVLGEETIGQFARKAGVPANQASSLLAALLPTAVDQLTPNGKLPETNSIEDSLSSLLASVTR